MSKTDSRVRRTDRELHRSLASLVHEKGYDAIVVKEILARADVARSTFYAHFDGKEELLLSCIRQTLAAAREGVQPTRDPVDRLLGFSLPVLQHIEAHRERSDAGRPQPDQRQVHQRLGCALAEQIEADVRRMRRGRTVPGTPPELLARYLASTFLEVLEWWQVGRSPPDAHGVHGLYRALVEPSLRAHFHA